MPQWEIVEELRQVKPGHAGTLIPSWNTGFSLRREPFRDADPVGVVRPGQRLQVLAADSGHLKVRQDAEGLEGWIPAHIVAPWPQG